MAVRGLVTELCGSPKPAVLGCNAERSAALIVLGGPVKIVIPINSAFPDADWLQHARELLSTALPPDHDETCEVTDDESTADLDYNFTEI